MKKSAVIGLLFVVGSSLFAISAVLATDLYLHHKFAKAAGMNWRGYRGPVVGRKKENERRIVALGGSTTFGYGVVNEESYPHFLEQTLRAKLSIPVSVVNLGMNNNGSYSFAYDLRDFRSLDYDIAILYEGYNDLGKNLRAGRQSSPLFNLVGYYPILPIVLREKALAIRYGGNLEAGYRNEQTVFKPTGSSSLFAAGLERVADVGNVLENQLATLAKAKKNEQQTEPLGECGVWDDYCRNFQTAISYLLTEKKKVLVLSQPSAGSPHTEQQEELRNFLSRHYGDNPDVRYLSLESIVDIKDPNLSFDRMHLNAKGNRIIAEAVAIPLFEMLNDAVNVSMTNFH